MCVWMCWWLELLLPFHLFRSHHSRFSLNIIIYDIRWTTGHNNARKQLIWSNPKCCKRLLHLFAVFLCSLSTLLHASMYYSHSYNVRKKMQKQISNVRPLQSIDCGFSLSKEKRQTGLPPHLIGAAYWLADWNMRHWLANIDMNTQAIQQLIFDC